MLNEQTFEKLNAMKLSGMAQALKEQMETAGVDDLSFEERFGMLVDAQHLWKEDRRMRRLLESARLKLPASMEDIDYRTPRGIDKSVMLTLGTCGWIRKHQNVIIVGPTGELLSIVVYGIIPDVSFAAMVMPPVPLPSGSLRR